MSGKNNRFDKLKSLFTLIKTQAKNEIDKESQFELASIINLFSHLDANSNQTYLELANVAISAIISDKANIMLAREIRVNLQNRIFDELDKKRPWYSIWRIINSPGARVLTGLFALITLFIPYIYYFNKLFSSNPDAMIMGFYAYKIGIVTIMGAFGSILSIMLRIQDFSGLRGAYASTLFFTGFLKPLIGSIFSLFVLSIISSEILPLNYEFINEKAFYFYSTISFVAGFSERFARDLISKAEETIVSTEK